MAYPSEDQTNRNRWQDEYDAATREHAWQNENSHVWQSDDFADDIPADIKHAFEE